jgi:hypothetical protein
MQQLPEIAKFVHPASPSVEDLLSGKSADVKIPVVLE